jgi:hypothetical protein
MGDSEKPTHGEIDTIEPTHNEDGTIHYAAERGQVATDK